jgi:hypothetical protein
MAKQDEPKKNLKAPSIKDKAKVVNEAPTGPEWEKIIIDGEEVYKKSSSDSSRGGSAGIPIKSKPKPKSTTSSTSATNKGTPTKPKPRIYKDDRPAENVEMEEYVRVLPKTKPKEKSVETPLFGEVKTYRREVPGDYKGYKMYDFADETGNYTNSSVRKAAIGEDIIDLSKSYDANGNFVPFKTGEKLSTGTVQQINTPLESGVNTATKGATTFSLPGTKFTSNQQGGMGLITPNATDTYVEKKYDSLGNELPNLNSGLKPLGTSGEAKETGRMYDVPPVKKEEEKPAYITSQPFAKGGVVSKIKGYYRGTPKGGVVGQNDPYAAKRAEDEKKKKEAQNAQNRETVGNVGSAYAKSYLASAKDSGSEDSATKTAMGAVSDMGAIGGVVGGVYGVIDGVARPEKNKAEAMNITYDSQGNATASLKSSAAAKDTAIMGSFLSPSEALSTRMSYKGGMTDISGKGYTKHLEKQAQEQLDVYNEANKIDKQNQAVAAREQGNLNPTISTQYDLREASFNDAKQLEGVNTYAKGGIVGKVKNMYADGGEIKGKGTAKSDSIKAEVKEGSFIVPAENAELAKGIRKLYLKAPNKKANLKQEEGEPVKLSNGEHLFTPEENEYLESIGIELEALAPDAEEGNEKSKGGPVKGTKIDGATWDGKNWISENGSKYSTEGGKKFTNKYNQSVAKEKANEEQKNASLINVYSRKLKEATDKGNTEEAKRLQSKINELSGTKKAETKTATPKVETKTATTEAPTQTTPTKPSLKAPKVTSKTEAGKFVPSLTPDTGEEVIVPGGNLSPNQIAANKVAEDNATAEAKALNASLPQSYTPTTTPKRKGLADYVGNIDPTSVVGIGQMFAGKDMLSGVKRPEFKATLDPTYNDSVNKALKEASFGLTPEQKFMAQQDIENAKRDSVKAGLNYAGGSGTTAFNFNRAAINDAWKAKLGLSVADQDARMAKQKYADVMAADRANILAANRRQAFNDAMYTFQQKQKAGSELVGAGLQNIIGAYRFNQDQKAMDKANAERNAWTKNI